MIHSTTFIEDWRCFKAGETFEFRPGVNLLVGDQGCGKSSLLKAILAAGLDTSEYKNSDLKKKVKLDLEVCKCYSFDFERDNPRILSYFGKAMQFQLGAIFHSHGETNVAIVESLNTAEKALVLLDEPDTALSIRSCQKIVQILKRLAERESQVLVAVHNLAVIQEFDTVLSIEHRKWMLAKEFIASQYECSYCGCYPCGCGG